jgi:hypothetical protein
VLRRPVHREGRTTGRAREPVTAGTDERTGRPDGSRRACHDGPRGAGRGHDIDHDDDHPTVGDHHDADDREGDHHHGRHDDGHYHAAADDDNSTGHNHHKASSLFVAILLNVRC